MRGGTKRIASFGLWVQIAVGSAQRLGAVDSAAAATPPVSSWVGSCPAAPGRLAALACALTVLLGLCCALRWISPRFVYGAPLSERPILALTCLLVAAGVAYLATVGVARRLPSSKAALGLILGAGALMRLLMATSDPMMEDDFYRYLWDGAVTAHGVSPYAYTPHAVLRGDASAPEAVLALGRNSGGVLGRVNHPRLGTVYPPVAQGFFALAYWLTPWKSAGLKWVYAAADLVSLGLLYLLLHRLALPAPLLAIYWLNPLLVKEVYNSVHMDLLALPLVLGSLCLAGASRHKGSLALLALGAGVKLWPVVLAPLFLWRLRRQPRALVASAFVFAGVMLLVLAPVGIALASGAGSGFMAFGSRWEMNDALFMVFPWTASKLAAGFHAGLSGAQAHLVGKAVVGALLAALMIVLCRRMDRDGLPLSGAALALLAGLFLLSPTQFPWYALWMLPLLAIHPRWSLLTLTVVLPLYYLKFHYGGLHKVEVFHNRWVWVEYAPVWLLLAVEWRTARRKNDPHAEAPGPLPAQ